MVPDAVPAAQQPRHEEDQEQLEEEEVMIGGEDQLWSIITILCDSYH